MFKLLKKKEETYVAFASGVIDHLDQYPEEAISQGILGDGFMIEPTEGVVVSPCDGKIVMLFPTLHAIGMQTKAGRDVLLHIGVDTVKLEGNGFTSHVKVDQMVRTGQKLMSFDMEYIQQHPDVKASSIALLFTENKVSCEVLDPKSTVTPGQENVVVVKEKR